ncbi:MAG TPA: dihydrofolate reductase [Bacteroidales bacterium]|nr:dihydrofolate reductase [Bacteroidales bacterium]
MKNISFIIAIAENNVIGKDNKLLWHLPDDMKWFKKHTVGCDVIMGRKTYESLTIKPLPKRKNIVITHNLREIEGCELASSIDDAIEKMDPVKENFVIGGGTIYEQFMPFVRKLYITRVHKSFDGDTYFAPIDTKEWILTYSEEHPADEKHAFPFTFQIFEKA